MAGEMKAVISCEFITQLAAEIKMHLPEFPSEDYTQSVCGESWKSLELKERLRKGAAILGQLFPCDYAESIEVLKLVAPSYNGLQSLLFPEYVEQFGLGNWDISMDALAFFTPLGSAEFAVRPFIRLDQERMTRQLLLWSESDDMHLRRLASEGCRPRLPWASPLRRFIKNPDPIIPILTQLKSDPEEYVRRSVANNLNDISKDHSARVLELGSQWIGFSIEVEKVVKHGLRTLLKKGHTDALRLFGFGDPKDICIENLRLPGQTISIGTTQAIQFDVVYSGVSPVKVRLEYAIDYRKANGSTSRKVFQAGESFFKHGKSQIERKQSFKQMTTRKHYPGNHAISILVNGCEKAHISFILLPE